MSIPDKYLLVRRSVLPAAGKGLFTTKPIRKGARITEYKGRKTSWKNVDHRKGTNPYIFYVKRDLVIDALSYKNAKARYANDARGLKRIKGLTNNARYIEEGKRVFIEAKKNIAAGDEILVGYGKEYWDAIKYNRKFLHHKP
jgi:SET domain-containing protein